VDTVARFGGDEFVVMLSELDADKVQSTEQAAGVAEKIRASVAEPYFLNVTHPGQESRVVEHRCSTSMGVVLFVNHESNPADIMNPNFPLAPTSNGSH
jgi:GGDEF domain-containing protein